MEKTTNNNIWVGQKDLTNDEQFIIDSGKELSLEETLVQDNGDGVQSNRRDFLRFLGFGLGAATLAAGCDAPIKRAIPYVVKPEAIIPGVATYYATSYLNGGDFASILVKTREGRPIKIESNDMAPHNLGKTSARTQAAVLSLYDINRLQNPMSKANGEFAPTTWEDLDKGAISALESASNVRILSGTMISPTSMKAVGEFATKYPSTKIVTIDPVSYSGMLDANETNFGKRAIPSYHFDKANVVLSFNADFLGTWVNPTQFAPDFISNRNVSDVNKAKMSRHFQVESHMSLTGSNADNRILVKPSQQGVAIAHVYNTVVGGSQSTSGLDAQSKANLTKAATQLKSAGSNGLVVSSSNNSTEQMMVNAINNAIGAYGTTVNMSDACYSRQGSESDFNTLIQDMNNGQVDCLIINDINPAYFSAQSEAFLSGLAKVKTKIACGMSYDETNNNADFIATTPHFLESWGDAMPTDTVIGLVQPTISPLFNSRQMETSLLTWAGSENLNTKSEQPYYEYLKKSWNDGAFASQSEFASFGGFWNTALQNGIVEVTNQGGGSSYTGGSMSSISKPSSSELEISFFETVNMGNGQFAGNPWLMEMPNPVDRTSWGNYLAVPVDFDGVKKMVGFQGLEDGDLVTLTVNSIEVTVPVVQQFGQMPGTVALALGYGRTNAGPTGSNVGVNVNGFCKSNDGETSYYSDDVVVSTALGKEEEFSCVQYHHTYGVKAEEKSTGEVINADEAATVFFDYFTGVKGFQGSLTDRSVIYTSNLNELDKNVKDLNHARKHAQHLNDTQIYNGFDHLYENGHHWGMYVDLNACTGCGACTVACMAENNVPVVGKKEVSRHHEMTWLRIDRYYYGDIKNPNVVYQPMMCQHCDNAPCENVCPVNATNHSSEGLNQMTYNRCIGTRYCANNCPYKVRRFNWLDYTTADIFLANQVNVAEEEIPYGAENLTRMVLNPDVTVRARGVIEKCSFCVQRIQEGKLTAKTEGRQLKDGEVKSACQTSCPTGAITFGDMNNPESRLNKKIESPLTYIALEEVNVRSSVNYTIKVNNRDQSLDA
jgi:molybdopterin-containing oxidoreductase family iron-sulfur binding subunit